MINYNVSLDKIKLTLKIRKPKRGQPYLRYVNTWVENRAIHLGRVHVLSENDFRLNKYRFAWTVTPTDSSEGTLYVACCYNGDYQSQRAQPYRVKIEFNPNKEGLLLYKHFCQSFLFEVLSIDSFDLAFDVPGKSTRDVILDTRCDVMTYGTTLAKTLYIAPKENGNGRIKVYDKDIERKNVGVELEKTLRIEVSCKNSMFVSFECNGKVCNKEFDELTKLIYRLQSVKIRSQCSLIDMGWELYALSQLTPSELENTLSLMSKNTRSKYRSLIRDNFYDTLDIDVATLKMHLASLLLPYAPKITSIWRDNEDVYAR